MTYTLYNECDKGVLLYHEKTHLNDRLGQKGRRGQEKH